MKSTEATTGYSSDCVVQENLTTTCNVSLRIPNLLGIIKTPTGDDYKFAEAYLRVVSSQKGFESIDVRVEDAKFGVYL